MADYERKMDKQRRLDDEAACVAAKEYYRRKESGSLPKNPVEFKKKRKASALSRPGHQRYLRENKWIKRITQGLFKECIRASI